MTFLPGGQRALVTERAGKLKLWQADGATLDIAGVPTVAYGGQGGFGDVILAPDFVASGTVYLSWVEAGTGDTFGAVVGKAKPVQGDRTEERRVGEEWVRRGRIRGRAVH